MPAYSLIPMDMCGSVYIVWKPECSGASTHTLSQSSRSAWISMIESERLARDSLNLSFYWLRAQTSEASITSKMLSGCGCVRLHDTFCVASLEGHWWKQREQEETM